MPIVRVTKEHQEQALAALRAEGYLAEYAGRSLLDIMAAPLPGRFIQLRAVAIAKGAHPAPAPTNHRPQVIAPEAPAHTHWQPPQPPKARPARQQAQLFDARRAASGDRDD